jgi:hypothetical protein
MIMAKTDVTLERPMMKISMSYNAEFILPWSAGIELLKCMEHAIFVTNKYDAVTNKPIYSRLKEKSFVVEPFMPEQIAQVLMGADHE